MTIEEQKLYHEGCSLWSEYVRVNGYSFEPKEEGLKKLSRLLDLSINYIRKCINIYLSA